MSFGHYEWMVGWRSENGDISVKKGSLAEAHETAAAARSSGYRDVRILRRWVGAWEDIRADRQRAPLSHKPHPWYK